MKTLLKDPQDAVGKVVESVSVDVSGCFISVAFESGEVMVITTFDDYGDVSLMVVDGTDCHHDMKDWGLISGDEYTEFLRVEREKANAIREREELKLLLKLKAKYENKIK